MHAPAVGPAGRDDGPEALAHLHVVVVMPAYNESDGLADFLHELDSSIAPLVRVLSFVVVDDASQPPLESLVRFLSPSLTGQVVLQVNDRNRGHGPTALAAYRRCLELAPDLVVHVDGDGQISGADVVELLRGLQTSDVVHGVRCKRTDPWFRRLLTRLTGLAVSGRSGVGDVNTPFRGYRPGALTRLLALTPQDAVVPHIHFTLLERHLAWHPRQVTVSHRPRRGGDTTGTTWRGTAATLRLPSLRLIRFCGVAAREVVGQRGARARVVPQAIPADLGSVAAESA